MRLDAVRDVVNRPAPFVTVHVEMGRTTEDARQQLEARWTTIRHRLEKEGVGAGLIEEIGQRLHDVPPTSGESRRTLVAAGDEIVLDEVQAGRASWPETSEVSLLPDLSGWLSQADRQRPFVLAVTDREGADIGFHPGLAAVNTEEVTVEGEDFYLTKVPQGDWAQKQFQQTAENTWEQNAADVADAIRSLLRRYRVDVVLLAGDERARHLVESALDDPAVPVVQVESGGRAAGASAEALWEEVRRVLAEFEARADADVIERLLESTGQGTGAARGLDEVLDALVQGQVERLVIDLDAARDLTVDPADHPGLSLPEGAAGPLPADRVLVAAAAATDAEVSVLPADETKGAGVAALLRWDDTADQRTES